MIIETRLCKAIAKKIEGSQSTIKEAKESLCMVDFDDPDHAYTLLSSAREAIDFLIEEASDIVCLTDLLKDPDELTTCEIRADRIPGVDFNTMRGCEDCSVRVQCKKQNDIIAIKEESKT